MEKDAAEKSIAGRQLTDTDGLAYTYEHVGGLEVPKVTWWRHRGLRRLYIMMPVLFLGSTINLVRWESSQRSPDYGSMAEL
jgi:hypothetical protein